MAQMSKYFLRCKRRCKSMKKDFLNYAKKYERSEARINTTISPIVIWWRIFSGPRRSNFPKSLEFGTIERPVHFACSMTTTMIKTERMIRKICIRFLVKNNQQKLRYYIKDSFFCKFCLFFGFFPKVCYYTYEIYEQIHTSQHMSNIRCNYSFAFCGR